MLRQLKTLAEILSPRRALGVLPGVCTISAGAGVSKDRIMICGHRMPNGSRKQTWANDRQANDGVVALYGNILF